MQSIEEIYKENFDIVYKYLFCLTHDLNISEELTQETFYKAIKNIDNELKKKKYKNIRYEENSDLIEISDGPEEQTISNDNKSRLYKELQKLDEQTRNVIYLRIAGELNFKEIGEILNKSEVWARVTYYRGKEKLKEVDKDE